MIQLFHHHFSPWKSTESSRTIAPESHWRQPLRWNRAAEKAGEKVRVRVGCDLFENGYEVTGRDGETLYDVNGKYVDLGPGQYFLSDRHPLNLSDVRRRMFTLIDATPWIDWVVSTESPWSVAGMTPPGTLQPPTARVNYWLATGRDAPRTDDEKPERANLFLGVTIHTQAEADSRIPLLLQTPVAVRWVECVPREEICVARWFGPQTEGQWLNVVECGHDRLKYGIGWLYVTGERGPDARPLQSIIEQCRSAGVPVWADGTDFNELPQLQK